MKSFHTVKAIVLASVIIFGFLLVLVGQVPELPSSKTISPGNFGTEIRTY